MMLYEFEDEATGERLEMDYPMASAPEIGSVVRSGGRRLRRLPPDMGVPNVEGDYFTNYQIPKNGTQAQDADGLDSRGRPYWTSARRADEWARKHSGEGGIPFDFDG